MNVCVCSTLWWRLCVTTCSGQSRSLSNWICRSLSAGSMSTWWMRCMLLSTKYTHQYTHTNAQIHLNIHGYIHLHLSSPTDVFRWRWGWHPWWDPVEFFSAQTFWQRGSAYWGLSAGCSVLPGGTGNTFPKTSALHSKWINIIYAKKLFILLYVYLNVRFCV